MTASILVVEDQPALQRMLSTSLVAEGYRVATASTGEEGLARIQEQEFDVIVTDMVMPGLGGLELLERSRVLSPRAAVILMTAYASLDSAVAALRRGACDYLEKPFAVDELTARVERLLHYRDAIWRERLLPRAAQPPAVGPAIVGDSAQMRSVRDQIARIGRAASNVLITGESGVGKELAARALHAASARRDHPFVAVNCGAIPDALLESQLFGHIGGVVTTADQGNPGLFVSARGGTLLLDEIGELPLALQVKLLRVLEDKQVWPVGATRPVAIDVRIVASTNRDLAREVEAGRFREDLFYRLDVLRIVLPPLREHRSDIPLLVAHMVERLNAKLGTRFLGIEHEAVRALARQPWKGNARELENVLERAMVLGQGTLIALADLALPPTARELPSCDLRDALRRFERQHLLQVLAETDLDKRKAADRLGISLASLYRKLHAADDPGAPSALADPS